jgi:hypothetical protein
MTDNPYPTPFATRQTTRESLIHLVEVQTVVPMRTELLHPENPVPYTDNNIFAVDGRADCDKLLMRPVRMLPDDTFDEVGSTFVKMLMLPPLVGAPMVRPVSVTMTAVLAGSAVPDVARTMDVTPGAPGVSTVPMAECVTLGVADAIKKNEGNVSVTAAGPAPPADSIKVNVTAVPILQEIRSNEETLKVKEVMKN